MANNKAAPLERSGNKERLLRNLATGDLPHYVLAQRFGVTQTSILAFSKRHADEIALMRQREDDHFWGLWTAQKYDRIATLQSMVEEIAKLITAELDSEPLYEGGPKLPPDADRLAKLWKRQEAALHRIAEELGQLPTRLVVESTSRAEHIVQIEGLTDEDLR